MIKLLQLPGDSVVWHASPIPSNSNNRKSKISPIWDRKDNKIDYLSNHLNQFYDIWLPLATKFPERYNINYDNYLVLIPVAVILILCFFKLQQNFFRSYVQVRKSFQLLFIVFLIAAISFYTEAGFQLNHFLLCAVPVAVFFSYYFLYATRKWFYELLYGLLLISIVYFQFNTF